MRDTPVQAGGGRDRASMVAQARQAIEDGSLSFAAASKLFDQKTRERARLRYAWCRRCDDLADGQEHGHGAVPVRNPQERLALLREATATALALLMEMVKFCGEIKFSRFWRARCYANNQMPRS